MTSFIIELQFIGENDTKELHDEIYAILKYFEIIFMRSFFYQIHLGQLKDFGEKKE